MNILSPTAIQTSPPGDSTVPASDFSLEHAQTVFFVYDLVLNRNPDPKGFQKYMDVLKSGGSRENIFADLATTQEALDKAQQNDYLKALISKSPPPVHSKAWKAEDRPLIVKHGFGVMQIELTNHCPFRCVMCPRTNHMTRDQGIMDIEIFKKVIDEMVAVNPNYHETHGSIYLHHFGESLTHPHFADFIRYAEGKGVRTEISVNPLMLSKKVIDDLLDAQPFRLLMALDGHDNESFQKIRGLPGVYEKSKQNLLTYLEQKVARGCTTRIMISVIDFMPNGNEGESREGREKFWRAVPGVDEFWWKPFSFWNGDAPEIVGMKPQTAAEKFMEPYDHLQKVTCKFPWSRVVVTWDGNVVPCCHDYNNIYVLGNVQHNTLSEIWNGPKMIALREEFRSNQVTNSLCKGCELLKR